MDVFVFRNLVSKIQLTFGKNCPEGVSRKSHVMCEYVYNCWTLNYSFIIITVFTLHNSVAQRIIQVELQALWYITIVNISPRGYLHTDPGSVQQVWLSRKPPAAQAHPTIHPITNPPNLCELQILGRRYWFTSEHILRSAQRLPVKKSHLF